jgi:divinyl chlorophyllide a 8-vinyl-reductase
MFGEGSTTCNPISELDLAEYMLDCIEDSTKWGKILNIGGPDAGMTMKEQGSMLFQVLEKKPRFLTVPIALFDGIIGFRLSLLATKFMQLFRGIIVCWEMVRAVRGCGRISEDR